MLAKCVNISCHTTLRIRYLPTPSVRSTGLHTCHKPFSSSYSYDTYFHPNQLESTCSNPFTHLSTSLISSFLARPQPGRSSTLVTEYLPPSISVTDRQPDFHTPYALIHSRPPQTICACSSTPQLPSPTDRLANPMATQPSNCRRASNAVSVQVTAALQRTLRRLSIRWKFWPIVKQHIH